jgi:hypothetical protein
VVLVPSQLTVPLGKTGAQVGKIAVIFLLDHVTALLERVLEVVVSVISIACLLDPLLLCLGLVQALLELLDPLVLAPVQLLLPALLDQPIIEIDACDEGAGDGGYEGCEDKPLLRVRSLVSALA